MRKAGLCETRDTSVTGRGGTQGGSNVLQGGGTRDITVLFGDVGPFGGNGEEYKKVTQRLPQIDCEESKCGR